MTIQKAYKYRIYPNEVTAEKLQWVLDRCRELYNAGLQERRDAYEMLVKRHPEYYNEETRKELSRTHRITYEDQANMLPKIKQIRKEYREIGSHVLQETLKRLDKAFQHFFRRVKNGEVPGYPRFQGKNRYDSFTYPDGAGWKIETVKEPNEKKGGGRGKLKLTKIGEIRVVLHRKMQGTIKTVTIKREADQWYVVFSCEVEKPIPLPVSYENVGIDLGVTHFAALSDGTFIESPRYYRKADKNLKKLQQTLSKRSVDHTDELKQSRQLPEHIAE